MEIGKLLGLGLLVGVPLYFALDPPSNIDKKTFRIMAERAWSIANREMELGNESSGLTWTGVAQLLDELSGRKDWGILEVLLPRK